MKPKDPLVQHTWAKANMLVEWCFRCCQPLILLEFFIFFGHEFYSNYKILYHLVIKENNANNHFLVMTENLKGFLPMNGQWRNNFLMTIKRICTVQYFGFFSGGWGVKKTREQEKRTKSCYRHIPDARRTA